MVLKAEGLPAAGVQKRSLAVVITPARQTAGLNPLAALRHE
jgi:hypothetical protein